MKTSMARGAFITVEGADGSGKTTQSDGIESWLSGCGLSVVRTREPGGTPLGEMLREILLKNDGASVSTRAELLLFFAARAQHLDEVIVPALAAGKWVLSERFTDATYAYQGGGRGMSMDDIATLEKLTHGTLQPDLTLLLDVPLKIGRGRVLQKDITMLNTPADLERSTADRFERQSQDFNKAVRDVYKKRAAKFKSRIKVIHADQSIREVSIKIEKILNTFRCEWQA